MSSELLRLHADVESAAENHKLCRNRLWDLGMRVNNWGTRPRPDLRHFVETHKPDLANAVSHEDHSLCTYDFCEFSMRDFTAVKQLHIPDSQGRADSPEKTLAQHLSNSALCVPIKGLFPQNLLTEAIRKNELTAWDFGGQKLVQHPRPFMALSHVWSDGTGSGVWGSVNECLFHYFRNLANKFECEGVWWDAICVPTDKSVRGEALAKMDLNYQLARVTLVHDTYLRNLPFKDAQTACFAIVSSSWFTRAWTALELARSQKLKVVFSDSIKDLDEDILREAGPVPAAYMIRLLRPRAGNMTVQRLLDALGPRHVSKAGDRAVISALLTGVALSPSPDGQISQSSTYKAILETLGHIAYGHLLHTSPTMVYSFTWCPTDIFKMPHDLSQPSLRIAKGGEVWGVWTVVGDITESDCIWDISDRFVEAKGRAALTNESNSHVVLTVPSSQHREVIHRQRGLVVKVYRSRQDRARIKCEYVSSIRFRNEHQVFDHKRSHEIMLCIGDVQDKGVWADVGIEQSAWAAITSSTERTETAQEIHNSPRSETSHDWNLVPGHTDKKWTPFHYAAWTGEKLQSYRILDGYLLTSSDSLGRQPIHLAAERANLEMITDLVEKGVYPNDMDSFGRTPLHYAAFGGSSDTWQLLLQHGANFEARDHENNLALHVAAEYGQTGIICADDVWDKIFISAKGRNDLTPLHLAILGGHWTIVDWLIINGANVAAMTQPGGFTPLHFAAIMGNHDIVDSLLRDERACKILSSSSNSLLGWTPLHLAAMQGDRDMVDHLVDQGADAEVQDKCGWTPLDLFEFTDCDERTELFNSHRRWTRLHLAAFDGLGSKIKALLSVGHDQLDTMVKSMHRSKALLEAAKFGYNKTVQLLIGYGWPVEGRRRHRRTPLHNAAYNNHEKTSRLLITAGANLEAEDKRSWRRPAYFAARRGHDRLMLMLEEYGADLDLPIDNWMSRRTRGQQKGGHVDNEPHILRNRALTSAMKNKHQAVVSLLLKRVDRADLDNALKSAIETGKHDIAEQLFDHGAKADAHYTSLLQQACEKGQQSSVELLLRRAGDSIDAMSDEYEESIKSATKGGYDNIIDRLLDHGTCTKGFKITFQTLMFAVRFCKTATGSRLLQSLKRHRFHDGDWTPLHQAAWDGNVDMTELLLKSMPRIKDLACEVFNSSQTDPPSLSHESSSPVIQSGGASYLASPTAGFTQQRGEVEQTMSGNMHVALCEMVKLFHNGEMPSWDVRQSYNPQASQRIRVTALDIAAGWKPSSNMKYEPHCFPHHKRNKRGLRRLSDRQTKVLQILLEAGADWRIPLYLGGNDAMGCAKLANRSDALKLLEDAEARGAHKLPEQPIDYTKLLEIPPGESFDSKSEINSDSEIGTGSDESEDVDHDIEKTHSEPETSHSMRRHLRDNNRRRCLDSDWLSSVCSSSSFSSLITLLSDDSYSDTGSDSDD